MAFITFDQLRAQRQRMAKAATQLLREAQTPQNKRVFLSHSHLDNDVLAGIIALFESIGASVYVDYEDETLPATPSARTARLLRSRINECPRFVLAASGHIRDSRWTPWELGFADGAKGTLPVAIMPLVPSGITTVSVEQEYLDCYPRFEFLTVSGTTAPDVYVRNPNTGKWWRAKDWLFDQLT